MKKLVSFLLALVLVLSSVSALAAYNDHTDYVDWPIGSGSGPKLIPASTLKWIRSCPLPWMSARA